MVCLKAEFYPDVEHTQIISTKFDAQQNYLSIDTKMNILHHLRAPYEGYEFLPIDAHRFTFEL